MKKNIMKRSQINKKIKVVFMVNDYYVNNFITIYKILKNSKLFDVKVLAVDFIEIDGTIKNTSANVRNYLENEHVEAIDYNNYDGTVTRLEYLEPDYVFYMTPYDIYFPYWFRSDFVCKYSKVCNIYYGSNLIKFEGLYDDMAKNHFYDNCSLAFVEAEDNFPFRKEILRGVGCVKLDDYLYYDKKNLTKDNKRIKIAWKPRWTLEEIESHFWDYIDAVYDFIKEHKEVDFYIFFHQLFNRKIKEKGCIEKYEEINQKLMKLDNYYRCSYSNFLDEVWTSDIFISDISSTLAEFSRTGKPIIFCNNNQKLHYSPLGEKVFANVYTIKNEKELIETLNMLLDGNDPKKEKREKDSKNYFYVPEGMTPSEKVIECLIDDFMGGN